MIPYKIETTKELLTSRAGLITISHLINHIGFTELVDKHFPQPQSNRGFKASVFVNSMTLMLHEGGSCLDDLRYIRHDQALRLLLNLEQMPRADVMGDWLRRLGKRGVSACTEVNRYLLQLALHGCKEVTLDIDATISASKNRNAMWTYKKCTGYMPIVGHIAETQQVVASDFRTGNVAPATKNLEFIHQCEAALPEGVKVTKVRIDAAGYQYAIIDECIDREILFAIRARMSNELRSLIKNQPEENWHDLLDQSGEVIEGESTCRVVHSMAKGKHAFTVVVQRKRVQGQFELDLESKTDGETMQRGAYIYRAIATNQDELTDNELVSWYNQRAEDSENRIKELKKDFGAERMPCSDFEANALYFALCGLAYNLFALMRALLPIRFINNRAKTIRWRLYAVAGKVIKHGRKLCLKVAEAHKHLLTEVLRALCKLAAAP